MALVQENAKIRKRNFLRSYSDSGKMILKRETGALYAEALDLIPCRFTYEETDISIEEDSGDE